MWTSGQNAAEDADFAKTSVSIRAPVTLYFGTVLLWVKCKRQPANILYDDNKIR